MRPLQLHPRWLPHPLQPRLLHPPHLLVRESPLLIVFSLTFSRLTGNYPTCGKCGKSGPGRYAAALGRDYHADCFNVRTKKGNTETPKRAKRKDRREVDEKRKKQMRIFVSAPALTSFAVRELPEAVRRSVVCGQRRRQADLHRMRCQPNAEPYDDVIATHWTSSCTNTNYLSCLRESECEHQVGQFEVSA